MHVGVWVTVGTTIPIGNVVKWSQENFNTKYSGLLTVVHGMPDSYHNMKLKDDGLSCATPTGQRTGWTHQK